MKVLQCQLALSYLRIVAGLALFSEKLLKNVRSYVNLSIVDTFLQPWKLIVHGLNRSIDDLKKTLLYSTWLMD